MTTKPLGRWKVVSMFKREKERGREREREREGEIPVKLIVSLLGIIPGTQ